MTTEPTPEVLFDGGITAFDDYLTNNGNTSITFRLLKDEDGTAHLEMEYSARHNHDSHLSLMLYGPSEVGIDHLIKQLKGVKKAIKKYNS